MDPVRVWRFASDAASRPYSSQASNRVCLQMEARTCRKLYVQGSWCRLHAAGVDVSCVDSHGTSVTLYQDQKQHRIYLLRDFWFDHVHHIFSRYHPKYIVATRGNNISGWKRGNALRVFCQQCTPECIARRKYHAFMYVGFHLHLDVLLCQCAACMSARPGRTLPRVHVGSRSCQHGHKLCNDSHFGHATRSFHCLASCWDQGRLNKEYNVSNRQRVCSWN